MHDIFQKLNRHLRDRRVPRKAAAVWTALIQRETACLIGVSNGTMQIPTREYVSKVSDRNAKAIVDSLKLLGLSTASVDNIMDSVARELYITKHLGVPDPMQYVDDALDEQIRDALVSRGVIDEHQHAAGIEAKYAELAA